MISFENTIIGYGLNPLIQIDECVLKSGVFYTLLGKNGSGKSTLLRSILGMTPLLSGKLKVVDKSVSELTAKQLAKMVAFVPSKFDGVQHLSTMDYVLMGRAPYSNMLGRYTSEDVELVHEMLGRLNIAHLGQRDTSLLSDGERQIASIAKALVQETPIIVLDEPTAFLDYSNRISVMTGLKEIAHSFNKCIIQSSHDLELCLEFSDEVLIVNHQMLSVIPSNRFAKDEIIELAYY